MKYNELPSFIILKNKVCFFAFMKYKSNYICIPKIIDNYKGKDYKEWFNNVQDEIKQYYKYFDGLGAYIYLVPEEDVVKTINPLEFTINKLYINYDYNFPHYIDCIINSISNYFNIDINDIALEGSLLLNMYKESSDIDLFVYGLDNANKISENFFDFCKSKNIRGFNKNEAILYVKERKKSGYGKTIKKQIEQFYRRYYGFIDDKQFSIVCVPKMNEFDYINLDRTLKNKGRFKGKLMVLDDSYSKVIPSKYVMTNGKDTYNVEIYNHYSINQIKKGEWCYIEGNCYLDENNNKTIILGFWNSEKERVDLL